MLEAKGVEHHTKARKIADFFPTGTAAQVWIILYYGTTFRRVDLGTHPLNNNNNKNPQKKEIINKPNLLTC